MRHYFLFISIWFLSAMITTADAQYVYATPTGKKYHLENCSYARTANQKLTIPQAQAKGLTPCSRCKPTSERANKELGKDPDVSSYGCASVQCQGYAKTQGRRCKRRTKNCNGYCFQHQR